MDAGRLRVLQYMYIFVGPDECAIDHAWEPPEEDPLEEADPEVSSPRAAPRCATGLKSPPRRDRHATCLPIVCVAPLLDAHLDGRLKSG